MKTQEKNQKRLESFTRLFFIAFLMLVSPQFISSQEVIEFKNSKKKHVKIISRNDSVVTYRLASDTTVIGTAFMKDVLSISKESVPSNTKWWILPYGGKKTLLSEVTDNIRLDDIDRSLRGATIMASITLGSELTGIVFSLGPVYDWYGGDAAGALGLFLGVGGIGMATDVTILTFKAGRQLKAMEFNPADAETKKLLVKKIHAAKFYSLFQNLTPLFAISAGVLGSIYNDGDFATPFFIGLGIGALMLIPEIVLIESARHTLHDYQRSLSVNGTHSGVGLVYNF